MIRARVRYQRAERLVERRPYEIRDVNLFDQRMSIVLKRVVDGSANPNGRMYRPPRCATAVKAANWCSLFESLSISTLRREN